MLDPIEAAVRFDGTGWRSHRTYARTNANVENIQSLCDSGFVIKVLPCWRDLYTSAQKLWPEGLSTNPVPGKLRITADQWQVMQDACFKNGDCVADGYLSARNKVRTSITYKVSREHSWQRYFFRRI